MIYLYNVAIYVIYSGGGSISWCPRWGATGWRRSCSRHTHTTHTHTHAHAHTHGTHARTCGKVCVRACACVGGWARGWVGAYVCVRVSERTNFFGGDVLETNEVFYVLETNEVFFVLETKEVFFVLETSWQTFSPAKFLTRSGDFFYRTLANLPAHSGYLSDQILANFLTKSRQIRWSCRPAVTDSSPPPPFHLPPPLPSLPLPPPPASPSFPFIPPPALAPSCLALRSPPPISLLPHVSHHLASPLPPPR